MNKVAFNINTKFLPAITQGDWSALNKNERSALEQWIGCRMEEHKPGGFWKYESQQQHKGLCEVEKRENVTCCEAIFTY